MPDRSITPDLSVVVPLYRPDPRHLRELLASISTAQDLLGSRLEVILSITDSDTSVPPLPASIRLECDRSIGAGLSRNWNFGVTTSLGRLVLLIGQDDVLVSPVDVAAAVNFMLANPDIVALGSGRRAIDDTGQPLRDQDRPGASRKWRGFPISSGAVTMDYDHLLYAMARFGNCFGEPGAVIFRRHTREGGLDFDERLVHAADIDFWLRLCQRGRVALWPGLCWYGRRLHAGSATQANLRSGAAAIERIQVLDRAARSAIPGVSREVRLLNWSYALASLLRALLQRNGAHAMKLVSAVYPAPRRPLGGLFRWVQAQRRGGWCWNESVRWPGPG